MGLLTFACAPSSFTPHRSPVAEAYFKFLLEIVEDGILLLPDELTAFRPLDGCENVIKIKHILEYPIEESKEPANNYTWQSLQDSFMSMWNQIPLP